MPKSAHRSRPTRAPRVKLAGTALVLVLLENGRQLHGALHQLSVTGGLLHVDKPLDEAIKVQLVFRVGKSTVRAKAHVLFPMWATQGYLQPFAFDDLTEDELRSLQSGLQTLLGDQKLSGHCTQPACPTAE